MTKPTREQRAESYFQLYYELAERDERRSLGRLVNRLAQLGISISLRTLKRYSIQYDWHQRAMNRDAEARQATSASPVSVAEMNTRQAQLGRGLQGIAGSMMRNLIQNPGKASPNKAARAAQVGAQLERAALGDAATREQIALDVWDRLGEGIVPAFREEIADLPDGEERARRFADSVDRVIEEHLREIRAEGTR